MANAAARKRVFIFGLLGFLAVGLALMLLREIPAPTTEKTVPVDTSKLVAPAVVEAPAVEVPAEAPAPAAEPTPAAQ